MYFYFDLCHMRKAKTTIDRSKLDPVFLRYGMTVYSNEYIQELRNEIVEEKRKGGKASRNLIPQEGFQENVLLVEADIKIIGGKRGGGKTFIALFSGLPYMFNADVNMYGFRKYEDDVKRGIYKSCKPVFQGFATFANSTYEVNFLNGKGATMKMEHLQDQSKIKDRFRGAEMPFIIIEEVAEHTRENLNTIFDLMTSNRSTAGVQPQFICTCNPVGKSNKLRLFLDWWIDPETDLAIKERSGKIRYFCRYGEDISEIVWGDSPEEVYSHPNAKAKIDSLSGTPGTGYEQYITSLTFIDGDYADNKILQAADPKYMNKISSGGTKAAVNDIIGIWRDIDTGECLLSMDAMDSFFCNSEKRDGIMRASCDVALTNDYLIIYAFDGHHVCDIEVRHGIISDDVIPFIEAFLKRNGVRKENFTYDSNGLGVWLQESSAFKGKSVPFNNKSAPSDVRMWNNLKSECAEKFVKAIISHDFSIAEHVLRRQFRDSRGRFFSVRERLMQERLALKRKVSDGGRFELIAKPQMKAEIGHSPDFIEGLFMVMHLFSQGRQMTRKGFENW